MQSKIELSGDTNLRSGDFYELAVEVSSNSDKISVQLLTKKLFELDSVSGPFSSNFEAKELDLEYFDNFGFIEFDEVQVPFKTFSVPEEGDGSSTWLDILIDSAIYQKLFGKDYQPWTTDGKVHTGLEKHLVEILGKLNAFKKIRMGAIGWEVSGMYCLDTLKQQPLSAEGIWHSKLFVNKDVQLYGSNWNFVTALK